MSNTIDNLDDALVGRTIKRVDARPLGDGWEVKGVTLDDGTQLSVDWNVGTAHDRVGLRVERRRKPVRA